jgi:hypothetical protein
MKAWKHRDIKTTLCARHGPGLRTVEGYPVAGGYG